MPVCEKAKKLALKIDTLKATEENIKELKAKADALEVEIYILSTGITPGSIIRTTNGKRRYRVQKIAHDAGLYHSLKVHARQYLKSGDLSGAVTPLYSSDVMLETEWEKRQKQMPKMGKLRL